MYRVDRSRDGTVSLIEDTFERFDVDPTRDEHGRLVGERRSYSTKVQIVVDFGSDAGPTAPTFVSIVGRYHTRDRSLFDELSGGFRPGLATYFERRFQEIGGEDVTEI